MEIKRHNGGRLAAEQTLATPGLASSHFDYFRDAWHGLDARSVSTLHELTMGGRLVVYRYRSYSESFCDPYEAVAGAPSRFIMKRETGPVLLQDPERVLQSKVVLAPKLASRNHRLTCPPRK